MIYALSILSLFSGSAFFLSNSKLSFAPPLSYVNAFVEIQRLKWQEPQELVAAKTQESFMKFLLELSERSLQPNHHGIAYTRLPNLTQVYVISNPQIVKQIYDKKNNGKIGQEKFFNRLSVLLGKRNLMSAPWGSQTHSDVRNAIFRKNKEMIPQVALLVKNYFDDYYLEQHARTQSLAEVMDALSRRILLATYFDKSIVEDFEKNYESQITKDLMSILYSLDAIDDAAHYRLLAIRNRLFEFGYELISGAQAKEKILHKESWLCFLLQQKLEEDPLLKDELERRGLTLAYPHDVEQLLSYAHEQDSTALAAAVRDAVNEAFFIPLLGFDATATALITALKICIQNPRIHELVNNDIENQELRGANIDISDANISYTQAVIYEALRLMPPAPVIPEMVIDNVELSIDGTTIQLPAGSLLFTFLEPIHQDSRNYPEIILSEKGKRALQMHKVDASIPFPERWSPKDAGGEVIHGDLFAETRKTSSSLQERIGEGHFLTFKVGSRSCPGLRLAMSELLAMFKMFKDYDFKLINEKSLASPMPYRYDSPLQRYEGGGTLKLIARNN